MRRWTDVRTVAAGCGLRWSWKYGDSMIYCRNGPYRVLVHYFSTRLRREGNRMRFRQIFSDGRYELFDMERLGSAGDFRRMDSAIQAADILAIQGGETS